MHSESSIGARLRPCVSELCHSHCLVVPQPLTGEEICMDNRWVGGRRSVRLSSKHCASALMRRQRWSLGTCIQASKGSPRRRCQVVGHPIACSIRPCGRMTAADQFRIDCGARCSTSVLQNPLRPNRNDSAHLGQISCLDFALRFGRLSNIFTVIGRGCANQEDALVLRSCKVGPPLVHAPGHNCTKETRAHCRKMVVGIGSTPPWSGL